MSNVPNQHLDGNHPLPSADFVQCIRCGDVMLGERYRGTPDVLRPKDYGDLEVVPPDLGDTPFCPNCLGSLICQHTGCDC
jgi:hypothetical protein